MSEKCVYQKECRNFERSCFKCFNYCFYEPLKERQPLSPKSEVNKQKKKGISFEQRGTKKYNQTIRIARRAARRQLASGAFSFAPGDMITEEDLTSAIAEFKERFKDKGGKKYITIHKEWLDKLKKEAKEAGKDYYFLPFSFKGEETDYVILEYDVLLSYIQTIHYLRELLEFLQKERGETLGH